MLRLFPKLMLIVGIGMTEKELKRLGGVLAPLQVQKCRSLSRRRETAASGRP